MLFLLLIVIFYYFLIYIIQLYHEFEQLINSINSRKIILILSVLPTFWPIIVSTLHPSFMKEKTWKLAEREQ